LRAVVQRVLEARVKVDGAIIGEIGKGLLAFVGVENGDAEKDADYIAEKISGLRIFEDKNGKMNLSCSEVGGQALVVSQFTLSGDCRKGRRPSFVAAASPVKAERLYLMVADAISAKGIATATGKFRADMKVELINDGPVTLLLDSRKVF